MRSLALVASILAALVSGSTSTRPLWQQEVVKSEFDIMHLPSMFEDWCKTFNKEYLTESEKLSRFAIWLKNFESIAIHNSKEDETFKMRLNQFGDLTKDEWSHYIHGNKGSCMQRDEESRKRLVLGRSNNNNNNNNKVNANPTSVDWTTKGVVTPVKNQGSCGSCWAFSATGATECNYAIAHGTLNSLSEQQLVDCSIKDGNLGCDGGLMDDAFKYIKSNDGLCSESEYPYKGKDGTCQASSCKSKYDAISGYSDVTKDNEGDLETAVVKGCVSVAVEADQASFQFYSSGVLSSSCGTKTDHGVLVVGYGMSGSQAYWKVKNSWGESWGMDGYLLICKACGKNGNEGECGINTDPSIPQA